MAGTGQIAEFLFVAGELKRVKRSGWWTAKIKDPESVAEHSFRTGLTAYLLALMENENETEAAKIGVAALAHDLHEARTLDLHKISAKYFDKHAGETKARRMQGFGRALRLTPKQQIIVKDADLLEMALQAKEYLDAGNAHARHWLTAARKGLKTAGAKKLYAQIVKTDSAAWWKGKGRRDDVVALAQSMAGGRRKAKTKEKPKARPSARKRKAGARPIKAKASKARVSKGGRGRQALPYKYWRWGRLPRLRRRK